MKSTLGKLSSADFWKGLFLAVITPVLLLLQQIIPTWTEWLASMLGGTQGAIILQAAASAFVAYLIKNFSTDDTKQAVKTIEKQGGTVQDSEGRQVTVSDPSSSSMRITILIPLIGLLMISSCESFVPSKDASQQVAKLNAKVETNDMYNLMATGTKAYVSYEQRYISIAAQIETITAADSVRKNAGDLFKQDKLVRQAWASRWAYHQSKGSLRPEEVTSEQQYMKSYWDAVMRAELSLK